VRLSRLLNPLTFLGIVVLFLVSYCDEPEEDKPVVSITRFPYNKRASLSITFDDGCPSIFTKVVPLLNQYHYKASFFIIASAAEQKNEWALWNDLILQGHEVGNHSLTHEYYLGAIDDRKIMETEIDSSFSLLQSRLIKPPFSFGHPFHSTNTMADQIVFQKHFASKISPSGFCKMIPLFNRQHFENELQESIATGRWLVTTSHGIDDCFAPMPYSVLVECMRTADQYSDDLYIDTFEALAKYKIELQNSSVRIVNNEGRYEVTNTHNLNKVFDAPLTLSITNLNTEEYVVDTNNPAILDVFIEHSIIYVIVKPNTSFFIGRR
jgi:peptidoglycan/xylan/chitin deacetylase (PgdA/CDA1 family)